MEDSTVNDISTCARSNVSSTFSTNYIKSVNDVNGKKKLLLFQGAESRLWLVLFLGVTAVQKERFVKNYRHWCLDKKLRKNRMIAEIRGMIKCRKSGVDCPVIFYVDLNNNNSNEDGDICISNNSNHNNSNEDGDICISNNSNHNINNSNDKKKKYVFSNINENNKESLCNGSISIFMEFIKGKTIKDVLSFFNKNEFCFKDLCSSSLQNIENNHNLQHSSIHINDNNSLHCINNDDRGTLINNIITSSNTTLNNNEKVINCTECKVLLNDLNYSKNLFLNVLANNIGRAISKIHSEDLIHGDLTTSNLMLRMKCFSENNENDNNTKNTIENISYFFNNRFFNEKDDIIINNENIIYKTNENNLNTIITKTYDKNESNLYSLCCNCKAKYYFGNNPNVCFLDFGLSYTSSMIEDKAVDLFVFEKALLSTHPNYTEFLTDVLRGYKNYANNITSTIAILNKLNDVRLRGRKRSMVG